MAGQDADCGTPAVSSLASDRAARLDNGSRMTRECHVRFCERLRGQFPRPTHHFGMKAHIGVDDESGLVHSVVGTAANVADVTQVDKLLHGDENMSVPTRVTPASRNALNMKAGGSSGRSPPAVVLTRSLISAVLCTKPSARLRRPRLRYEPRSSIRSG